MFPDYQPKKTPDTIFDYGVLKGSRLAKILNKLGAKPSDIVPVLKLNKLKLAVDLFKEYKPKAEKYPGRMEEGHPLLDGAKGKYVPSEEELVVSEIGKRIAGLLFNLGITKRQLDNYKKKNEIPPQELSYQEINFSHTDIMGSGRFFHAEKAHQVKKLQF